MTLYVCAGGWRAYPERTSVIGPPIKRQALYECQTHSRTVEDKIVPTLPLMRFVGGQQPTLDSWAHA